MSRVGVGLAGLGRMGRIHAAALAGRWAYAAELDAFARAVRDGTPPPVTGRDALAAFDLALAADESWRTGRPVSPEVAA